MNHENIIDRLCVRYPMLYSSRKCIADAADLIIECYSSGGKLLVCGNGGSSADSEHLVGELMKSFQTKRAVKKELSGKLLAIANDRGAYLAKKLETGLPAIALSSQTSLTTAISNDIDADLIFAQQVLGYGKDNDILLAISTSGESQNIVDACITAKSMNLNVIGLTGQTGGKIKKYCDVLINVNEKQTAYIQELHLPVLHTLCQIIEIHFFGSHKMKNEN